MVMSPSHGKGNRSAFTCEAKWEASSWSQRSNSTIISHASKREGSSLCPGEFQELPRGPQPTGAQTLDYDPYRSALPTTAGKCGSWRGLASYRRPPNRSDNCRDIGTSVA